jgi:hypothetical protein
MVLSTRRLRIFKNLAITTGIIAFCASCMNEGEKISNDAACTKTYLHISHTRTDSNPNMDPIVESIDYKQFDMLWLGGDLTYLTSQDDQTMLHVDSIFNIRSNNTLWALGNHDYSNLDKVISFSDRPAFYSYHKNGITFFVMDTQDSLSSIVGSQLALFNGITDTLSESSHLIILHHKLIWMYANSDLESQLSSISNGEQGDCFYCINPNNFYTDIYPKLLEVKQRGVEVLCIGGDIGFKAKEFEYLTPEGIYFLASGISSGASDNKALLFYHDQVTKLVSWEFKLIKDLTKKRQ